MVHNTEYRAKHTKVFSFWWGKEKEPNILNQQRAMDLEQECKLKMNTGQPSRQYYGSLQNNNQFIIKANNVPKDSWPLNNMGLNCMGPLIFGFLKINAYYGTSWSVVGESTDARPWIGRADCKFTGGFLTGLEGVVGGVSTPNLQLV